MSPENSFGATPWNRLITWAWPSHPARWRDVPWRVRPTLVTVFRLTAAAVAAYVLSQVVTPGTPDLTGPLTALLVVQATAFSTIKMGAVRVGAVLSGILVATLLSTWSGLTWWSLAAAIATSLLLAKVLRLGDQALAGETGNVGIAGHRTTFGRPFNRLNELGPGDVVTLETPFATYTYKAVTPFAGHDNPWVVTPSDFSVVSQGTGHLLTLTTCHPKGSARQRLVMRFSLTKTDLKPAVKGSK
mgnify:CR=1 FL=1